MTDYDTAYGQRYYYWSNSSGIPHRHAINRIIAGKISQNEITA